MLLKESNSWILHNIIVLRALSNICRPMSFGKEVEIGKNIESINQRIAELQKIVHEAQTVYQQLYNCYKK